MEARPAAPANTITVPFEDLEGAVLVSITVLGADRETSGTAILDTGAGYLALENEVADRLGLGGIAGGDGVQALGAAVPLARVGALEFANETPALRLDLAPFRGVTDRPLIALIGQRPLRDRVIVIDYPRRELRVIAPGAGASDESQPLAASRRLVAHWFGRRAAAIPFELCGDGKILVRGSLTGAADTLNWVVDTGATKTVLFSRAWAAAQEEAESWPTVAGLQAPTVLGSAAVRIVRAPALGVYGPAGACIARRVDCARFDGPLESLLSRTLGTPVDGLLGYSFLRRFRVAVDYVHSILWLDPLEVSDDMRPYEYSTIGVQLERAPDGLRVMTVADGSPAAVTNVRVGDLVRAIDAKAAEALTVSDAGRLLEGPPGSAVTLDVERGGERLRFRIVRRRLL